MRVVAVIVVGVVASCQERATPKLQPIAANSPGSAEAGLPAAPQRRDLAPPAVHDYAMPLRRAESIELVVTQVGIDVVVEAFGPDGKLVASVDSPNGNHGDESLELIAATDGNHRLVVRSLEPGAPAGQYRIAVIARRDVAATQARVAERARARADAASWFAARAGAIGADFAGPGIARFEALAKHARVIGLGEATHGSRQLADLRVSLVRRLVERHGTRAIALEGSAARFRQIDRWARRAGDDAELERLYGSQWINRRAFLGLARFVRGWNRAHRTDPVRLVGVDPIDNAPARALLAGLADFVEPELLARIAAADADALAFRRTTVAAADWKVLRALAAQLEADRARLVKRSGAERAEDVIAAARTLAQFAELNTDTREPTRSRDAFMAANLLAVLGRSRAVFLAHDAHVAHPPDRMGSAGGILREALQSEYASIATAFGEGGFVAQVAGDATGKRATFAVPAAAPTSIDGVLRAMGRGDAIATWPEGAGDAPPWLRVPQPMYWVGGLFATGWQPSQWTRPCQLVVDHDGVVFLERVAAEAL